MTTMTKKRVAELEGAQLDWAVGFAEGRRVVSWDMKQVPEPMDCALPYSTDWSCGGPIIEREIRILDKRDGTAFYNGEEVSGVRWLATCSKPGTFTYMGRTPLIAAMRAFVASKLGDEVEVPE